MSRFVYEKGDTEFIDLQCEMCLHWRSDTPHQCVKYSQKPEDIMQNLRRCPQFEWKNPWPF